MRHKFILTIFFLHFLAISGLAQQDRLQGRWEGTTRSAQQEMPATAIFKKEADAYTGTITGLQGPITFKEVKVEGDDVAARAEVDSPQAGLLKINYKFVLQGETLKGEGSVEVNGQLYKFPFDLKRVSTDTTQPPQQERRPARTSVPQPQQKQSLAYFVGEWTCKWVGRESVFGTGGHKEGVTTFKLSPDGKTLESRTELKSEAGAYQESAVISFDESTKTLSFSERRGDARITSKGNWTSPLAIRFTIDPIKLGNRTLQLKRTITIISAYSFTVTEELSEDGGPFARLGNALFSKVTR